MGGIFISYRRDDSPGHAGRVFDRLSARFGGGAVFMDVQAIETGADFVESIDRAIGACDAVVAVIGPGWVSAADSSGRRRLDDPEDFVRLEIAHALRRQIRVLPVLVEHARLPPAAELPPELAPLLRRQALALRDDRWDADIRELVESLERILPSARAADAAQPSSSDRAPFARRRRVLVGAGVALVAGVVAALVMMRPGPPGGSPASIESPVAERSIPPAAEPAPGAATSAPEAPAAPPRAAPRTAGADPPTRAAAAPASSGLGILWLGVRSDRRSEDPPGVHVSYVYPGGPAAGAGIAVGDVLVEVAGKPVARFGQLQDAVTAAVNESPGAASEVALVRDRRTIRVSVVFDREFRPRP